VGELGSGAVAVEMDIPELGFAIEIGEVVLTECETVNQFTGSKTEPPQFTRGYGLVFGQSERKAISMALVDRALRWEELGEDNVGAPAQDAEFVLYHGDNVQATGFPRAHQAAALRRFPVRAGTGARATAPGSPAAASAGRLRNDRLQLRLSRRADQADDPPRDPEGAGHPRLSGALRQPRDADALWLGHRRRAGVGR
jgi:hypothetical protein